MLIWRSSGIYEIDCGDNKRTSDFRISRVRADEPYSLPYFDRSPLRSAIRCIVCQKIMAPYAKDDEWLDAHNHPYKCLTTGLSEKEIAALGKLLFPPVGPEFLSKTMLDRLKETTAIEFWKKEYLNSPLRNNA